MQFYARAKRIWQSQFVIMNPQTEKGAGVWMTSCLWEMVLRIWGFYKTSWILSFEICSWVFGSLETDVLNIARCAVRWGGASIGSIVSLSSCNYGPKPEINKPFVPKTTESTCICICITVVTDIDKLYNLCLYLYSLGSCFKEGYLYTIAWNQVF